MEKSLHIRAKEVIKSCSFIAGAVLIIAVWASTAAAFYQPDYQNRCVTNFLDAAIEPGFILQNYFYNYKATDLRMRSHELDGDFRLSANVNLTQAVYISEKKWGWAHPGIEVIVPMVNGHLTDPAGNRSHKSGLGDVFVAFMWQSDPIEISIAGRKMPFFWRLVSGVFLPVGEYDHEDAFNPGSNFFTSHTYLSNTLFLSPKWSVSTRFMYNFHTKNSESGPDKDDLTAGQLFNVHFATAYEVYPGVRLGLMGHYWRQTTDDKLNGKNQRGRELLFAWGPGIFVNKTINKKNLFMEVHTLFDTAVRNRPKGITYQIRAGIMF